MPSCEDGADMRWRGDSSERKVGERVECVCGLARLLYCIDEDRGKTGYRYRKFGFVQIVTLRPDVTVATWSRQTLQKSGVDF